MICQYCKNETDNGSKFCTHCGRPLNSKLPPSEKVENTSRILFAIMMYTLSIPFVTIGYSILGILEHSDVINMVAFIVGIIMFIAYLAYYIKVVRAHVRISPSKRALTVLICVHAVMLLVAIGMIVHTSLSVFDMIDFGVKGIEIFIIALPIAPVMIILGSLSGISLGIVAIVCGLLDAFKLIHRMVKKYEL